MARKIAPTLQASLHYIPGRAGTRSTAQRELRALLAVAKYAKAFHRYVNEYSDPIDDYDMPLRNALACLDKLGDKE